MSGLMRKIFSPFAAFINLTALILLNASCADLSQQNIKEQWAPNTKLCIDELIINNSKTNNAYAVFDWDNTSIIGDVQENLFVYQLLNLHFKLTPEEFKYSFVHYAESANKENRPIPDQYFTPEFVNEANKRINILDVAEDCLSDYKFIYMNYRKINPDAPGNLSLPEIKNTPQYKNFIAKMFFTYSALYESFPSNIAYTWVMYVTTPGFTSEELKSLVEKSIEWGINHKISRNYFDSDKSSPGRSGVIMNSRIGNYFSGGIRPVPEMQNLYKNLRANNIDVYISSASMQDVVEVFAQNPKFGYNLSANSVLGMRLKKNEKGIFIPQYDYSGNYAVNGKEGKTFNIVNKLVSKYKSNPIMIAGDSDGDYDMITKFSGLNGVNIINEYKPLQLALILNRLKGNEIGELCRIAAGQLNGLNDKSVKIVLQGRDENSGRFIQTEKTLKYGVKGEENCRLLP
jgi:hypothetical protein